MQEYTYTLPGRMSNNIIIPTLDTIVRFNTLPDTDLSRSDIEQHSKMSTQKLLNYSWFSELSIMILSQENRIK